VKLRELFVFLERSLFLGELDNLLVDVKTFASTHVVHMPLSHVLDVRLLAEVQVLLLGRRNPERIDVDHLTPSRSHVTRSSAICYTLSCRSQRDRATLGGDSV